MTGAWGQVPALVDNLPEPILFKRELIDRIQHAYTALQRERGPVHVAEDTWAMLRRIGAELDRVGGYNDAFAAGKKLLKQLLEEELVEAVGEQDGIPNQGMTIPDGEGDIRLSLEKPKVYAIDIDQLVGVLVAALEVEVAETSLPFAAVEGVGFVVKETVRALLSWGKFEPQVSKVKGYAATLARNGNDQAASIVTGAITETTRYKGVAFERKQT